MNGWDVRGHIRFLVSNATPSLLHILIADMKSSAEARVEHRLQVAFYAEMLDVLLADESLHTKPGLESSIAAARKRRTRRLFLAVRRGRNASLAPVQGCSEVVGGCGALSAKRARSSDRRRVSRPSYPGDALR